MSPGQLIELIIFALVVFVLINKLLSSLGKTSDSNNVQYSSFFGKTDGLKDVTGSGASGNEVISKKIIDMGNVDEFIVTQNKEDIAEGLIEIEEKLKITSFSIKNFVNNAKSAFFMIIDGINGDINLLSDLIDPRYVVTFKNDMSRYGALTDKKDMLSAVISEVYSFGNNCFIKVIFSGNNVLTQMKQFKEEWTFSKNNIESSHNWYLSNIERFSFTDNSYF